MLNVILKINLPEGKEKASTTYVNVATVTTTEITSQGQITHTFFPPKTRHLHSLYTRYFDNPW